MKIVSKSSNKFGQSVCGFVSDVTEPMIKKFHYNLCMLFYISFGLKPKIIFFSICGFISDGKHLCICICGAISLLLPKDLFVFVV